MKKVTGYIGALIIVMALMGSILAGYALNINGQNVTVNAYEKVTDVSGLYTHTDQKTYIDYNPASNYIGYDESTFSADIPVGQGIPYYKEITDDVTFTISSDGSVTIDGNTYPSSARRCVSFICDKFYIQHSRNGPNVFLISYDLPRVDLVGTVTVSKVGDRVTVSDEDTFNDYWGGNTKFLRLSNSSDYDYLRLDADVNLDPINAYYSNRDQIVTVSSMTPKYGYSSGTAYVNLISVGEKYYNTYIAADWTGFYDARQMPADGWMFEETPVPNSNIYRFNPNFRTSQSDDWDSTGSTKTITEIFVFYPAYVTTNGWAGVNYTESNRVNNYPLPRVDGMTTQTETINISNLSGLTNYARVTTDFYTTYADNIMGYSDAIGTRSNNATVTDICYHVPMVYNISGGGSSTLEYINYKLTDILTAGANIPAGTTQIIIDLSSNNPVTYNVWGVSETFDLNQPVINTNEYVLNTHTSNNNWYILKDINNKYGQKNYAVYDLTTGYVDVFSSDGVKISTMAADSVYIGSTKIPTSLDLSNNTPYITINGRYTANNWTYAYSYYGAASNDYSGPASSNDYTTDINLTYYVPTSTQKYVDITKGFSIKPDVFNSTWNNQYENGIINILFRAENANGTYHNTIEISGNEISIDYTGGHFSVDITDDAPATDVGKWRSIVLKIDLLNGTVSAIPVRTFNSYTNVQLDNTVIPVGDLNDATPTNRITWQETNNSFTFNIYSTSVFLDTYDTVMVNPTLDITEYFTDLGGFYRLDMSNFSIYGDSITVNGVTGSVTGNNITFDEDTFILKDVSIIYADGHAYFKDSYTTLDLGAITTNDVLFNGVWYFETTLLKGFYENKQIYEWNWSDFIFDNTQFCIFYIGLALIGLVVARRFCILSVIDYIVFVTSIIVALSIQVIA